MNKQDSQLLGFWVEMSLDISRLQLAILVSSPEIGTGHECEDHSYLIHVYGIYK